jgi:hypothetical protein
MSPGSWNEEWLSGQEKLLPVDLDAELFEHGGDAVGADQVACADGDEGGAFALQQLGDLFGEAYVALDDECLVEVGLFGAEVTAHQVVKLDDVAGVPGCDERPELVGKPGLGVLLRRRGGVCSGNGRPVRKDDAKDTTLRFPDVAAKRRSTLRFGVQANT